MLISSLIKSSRCHDGALFGHLSTIVLPIVTIQAFQLSVPLILGVRYFVSNATFPGPYGGGDDPR